MGTISPRPRTSRAAGSGVAKTDPSVPATFDWAQARVFLRRTLSRRLGRGASADVEDLTQEALVRLLRAMRKEPARNPEALMTTIAGWTWVDFLRKRRTWGLLFGPGEGSVEQLAPCVEACGDPAERMAFAVLEFFRTRSPKCHDLARRYLDEQSWMEVASALGESHEAVRQRWSRCLEAVRRVAGNNPDVLWAWTKSPPTSDP